jgi:GT2 family glycosyltransferase
MRGNRPLVSIIVANWEGEAWIVRCVSALLLSARATGHPFELIVVDDASTDGSADLVAARFPAVRLLRNRENIGFGASTMRGVRAAHGSIVLLCNNDLLATETFVGNLVRWFLPGEGGDPRLFGVSARTLAWYDGAPNQLCMTARWRGGRITPAWSEPARARECLFVQAGAAAYRRRALLELGGLADDFAPGYWEDYDLSYRAAKAGWRCLYDPEAVALHVGGGSMTRRFGRERVEAFKARNHLVFEWRNLTDARLLAGHALRLGVGVGREWLAGRPPVLTRALVDAVRRMPAVLRARAMRPVTRRADRELLALDPDAKPSY